ncbi:MAG TPA: four helix bundle protein [Fulvivirga sp.]|nr:four helix bundle protein [Fulvivirga sp.]
MRNDKENIIVNLTFQFALEIIDFTEEIKLKGKYSLADQLFRSGTSIGANVREAQNAESKADFIHKLKIAAKEADETEYWLCLCKDSGHYPTNEKLLMDIQSIIKVLSKIISTSKK